MCVHEKDNAYNFFAIEAADITSGMTVGHLLTKTSRFAKLLLDPRTRLFAILTSTNSYISPLVQRGLEIPCRIEIHMAPTVRNK